MIKYLIYAELKYLNQYHKTCLIRTLDIIGALNNLINGKVVII